MSKTGGAEGVGWGRAEHVQTFASFSSGIVALSPTSAMSLESTLASA